MYESMGPEAETELPVINRTDTFRVRYPVPGEPVMTLDNDPSHSFQSVESVLEDVEAENVSRTEDELARKSELELVASALKQVVTRGELDQPLEEVNKAIRRNHLVLVTDGMRQTDAAVNLFAIIADEGQFKIMVTGKETDGVLPEGTHPVPFIETRELRARNSWNAGRSLGRTGISHAA